VYAASLWAAVKPFGYKTLPNNSNGANTHCLENVMAMDEGDKERLACSQLSMGFNYWSTQRVVVPWGLELDA